MRRVGNADTIADIEFVIDAPPRSDSRPSWIAHGVECTRNRHRFSGPDYEFNIEITDLRRTKGARISSWRIIIVSESWQSTNSKTEIRATKWLKVLEGKASEIKAWMRACRAAKLNSAATTRPSSPSSMA